MSSRKFTTREGLREAAHILAAQRGHQQWGTDHLLKVMLGRPEAWPPASSRGKRDARDALAAASGALAKRNKVSGRWGGARSPGARAGAPVFDTDPEDRRTRPRRTKLSLTDERLAGLAWRRHTATQTAPSRTPGHADVDQPGHQRVRKGRTAGDSASAETNPTTR